MYLYRAVDGQGNTAEFFLSRTRGIAAAKAFFRKALKHHQEPHRITLDGHRPSHSALRRMGMNGAFNFRGRNPVKIRCCQYLNNVVEQDHRRVKGRLRPMLGFKAFYNARCVIIGIELAQKIGVGAGIGVSEHASGGGGVQSIIEIGGGNVVVAAQSSRVNRQDKKKYRIRNWREYERGLRSRGDVTIWLSEDAIAAWVPPKNGLRGGQRRYSNLAVRTALTLRVVFSLPLRPTEGFLDSLLRLMGRNLKAPEHTTLSRRNQIVAVPPLTRSYDGPIDLIVDSTGLKILGCGEWNAHKHKASKKRRDWRKLHIGVDAEGFIVAAELTASSRDDASTLPALLDTIEVPIRRFTADGAYDHRSVYDQLSAAGTENVVIVIPPRRCAVSAGPTDGPWAQRDTALERIHQVGRREWQKESGYRQQARVENSFFRYKSVLGGGLQARHGKAQRREVAIGCHILNRMAEMGRPKSCAVVS